MSGGRDGIVDVSGSLVNFGRGRTKRGGYWAGVVLSLGRAGAGFVLSCSIVG